MPDSTYDESAQETVLDVFGWHVDDEGWIRTEGGEFAPTYDGEPMQVDEHGGIVELDGDPVLIRNDISQISDWVKENHDE